MGLPGLCNHGFVEVGSECLLSLGFPLLDWVGGGQLDRVAGAYAGAVLAGMCGKPLGLALARRNLLQTRGGWDI